MKRIHKVLAALLAVCMMIPLFTVASSAKSYKGKSLVVLGDSIAAGYGLVEGNEDILTQTIKMPHGEWLDKAWPTIVRNQYGFSKATSVNLSRNMWRTDEFLRLLDPSFEKELCKPENAFDQYISDYLMFPNELTKPLDALVLASNIQDAIKQADVLVFSLGSNDIMTASICEPLMIPFYHVFGRQAATALGAVTQQQVQAIDSFEGLEKFVLGVTDLQGLTQIVERRTQQFFKNYERLLDIIYKLNPDVKVYTLGITYPFKDLKLFADIDEHYLSKLNDSVIKEVRTYMTKQSRHRNKAAYIDVSTVVGHKFNDVVSPNFLIDFIVDVHPDAAGHKKLAQIIGGRL